MTPRAGSTPPRPPLHPKRPDRVCWGCDRYCPADALYCGNGTIRTPHPAELFGEDWDEWSRDEPANTAATSLKAEG